ncbi:hypothetical protein Dform_00827 [Dehalogenimonas formicexedens]|uniref:HEAT repeat domain-containing protein n=1 Tax=Dehalogenimonas formicexedens TaxID=1839801 RepID=A0A1P8F6T1_9CHLR|nr:hypothetical protein [Dehalogenimonas formicexedens]APV44173.1 hypothetical protein Dform_00827 [Dehalogenimonas formicexedens]
MTVSKIGAYREELKKLRHWEPYLLAHSGLPGPRGNLELARAVFEEGDEALFDGFLSFTPDKAPANSPGEFLHFCGVYGLGKYLSKTNDSIWEQLKTFASDPWWRTREAVAMALQSYGDRDIDDLTAKVEVWAGGNRYQQRAAAATLCEPRLLQRPDVAGKVIDILDTITGTMVTATDRREESFKVLRQALGYCWSVAVAAVPLRGKSAMEKWLVKLEPDIRRIMKDNLSKNRLIKMDACWVERWRRELSKE